MIAPVPNLCSPIVPAAGLALALFASGCTHPAGLAPVTHLRLEGSVYTTHDSLPTPGAFVRLTQGVAFSGAIAGTLTDTNGAFWIFADVSPAQCTDLRVVVGTVGLGTGLTGPSQVRCTAECQRFEFALIPNGVAAHFISEPHVTSCKS
jgi:hypothetical protein